MERVQEILTQVDLQMLKMVQGYFQVGKTQAVFYMQSDFEVLAL